MPIQDLARYVLMHQLDEIVVTRDEFCQLLEAYRFNEPWACVDDPFLRDWTMYGATIVVKYC